MRIVAACGVAAACLFLPACATVTRGTSQKFNIETSPSEAKVSLSTGQECTSPCKLKVKRKNGFVVTATKDGYEKATATVQSKVRTGGAVGAAGNVLLGGAIGILVDAKNGSMNDLTPNPLLLELKPVASASAAAPVAAEGQGVDPAAAVAPADAAAPAVGGNETATVGTEPTPGQE